jgi:hypothetical protein
MWEQVEAKDIERARQTLRDRLDDATSKHAEEMTALRARHAEELRQLEAKQTEIEALDRLIDAFAEEFGTDAPHPVHAEAGIELTADNLFDREEDGAALPEHSESNEIAADEEAQPAHGPRSIAETLAVRYMSPDFRPFRKFGT